MEYERGHGLARAGSALAMGDSCKDSDWGESLADSNHGLANHKSVSVPDISFGWIRLALERKSRQNW